MRGVASLVSAGTEMLVYRGDLPAEDELGLETCAGSFGFPVKYAYQIVGRVEAAGENTPFSPGDFVFCRHPHQERFTMRYVDWLIFKIPEVLTPERAIFANLLDVALNCNLDVPIRHGDVVVVYGQGVVGSMCAQLAHRTAGRIVVVDPAANRREFALTWGADAAVEPDGALDAVMELCERPRRGRLDRGQRRAARAAVGDRRHGPGGHDHRRSPSSATAPSRSSSRPSSTTAATG